MISKKQISLIHVAAKELGLSREDYVSILKTHGGAESSKHLDDLGAERVIRFFQAMGFKYKKCRRVKDFTILATKGQRAVIYHLMEDLQWWPARLTGFLMKMVGKEMPEQLTRREAVGIIEGLKKMRNRNVSWS